MARAASDWIASLSKQASASSSAPAELPKLKLNSAPVKAAAKGETPVAWLMGALGAAGSAVTSAQAAGLEAKQKINDELQNGTRQENTVGQKLSDIFSPFGAEAKAGADAFGGAISGHPSADTKHGANVIDDVAKSYGVDKVNPIARGVGGFALDVAEDPLTYIPGPDVIKGIKTVRGAAALIKDGGRAADEAAPSVIDALKQSKVNVEQAAASKAAAKASAKAIKQGAPVAATKAETTPAAELLSRAETPTPVVAQAKKAAADTVQQVEKTAAKVDPVATATVEAPKIPAKSAQTVSDFIKGLGVPKQVEDTTKAVTDPSIATPLDRLSYAQEVAADPKTPDIVAGKGATAVSKSDLARVAAGETEGYTPAELRATNRVIDQKHAEYIVKQATAQAAGKVITAGGTDVAKAAPESAAQTIANQLSQFKAAQALHETSMRSFLGDDTFNALNKMTDPAKFDTTVANLDNIVSNTFDKGALGRANRATKAFAQERGLVPKPGIVGSPAAVRTPDDVVAPVEPAAAPKEKIAIQATAAAEHAGLDSIVTQDVVKAAQHVIDTEGPALAANRLANQETQYQMAKAMRASVDRDARFTKAGNRALGHAASQQRMGTFLQRFTPLRQAVERAGFPATMGKGDNEIYLGYDELLKALNDADPKMAEMQFNVTGGVNPHNLMDMAAAISHGETNDNVLAAMLKDVSTPRGTATLAGTTWTKATLVDAYVKAMKAAGPDIQARAAQNIADVQARASAESSQLAAKTVAQLKQILDEGTSEQSVKALLGIPDGLKAEQKAIQSLDLSREIAQEVTNGAVPDVVHDAAVHLDNSAKAVEQAMQPRRAKLAVDLTEDASKAAAKSQAKKLDAEVAAVAKVSAPELDLSSQFDKVASVGLIGKTPFIGGLLANLRHDAGMPELGFFYSSAQQTSRMLTQRVVSDLNGIAKQFMPDTITRAGKMLAAGVKSSDPETAAAMDALKTQIDFLHNTDGTASVLNTSFWRNGTNIQHLNDNLQAYRYFNDLKGGAKVPDIQFDMEKAAADAKASGKSIVETTADQWKTLIGDDPLAYLSTMHAALQKTNMEQSLVQSFERWAKGADLTSTVPKAGMVKLVNGDGKSVFAKYLDPDAYYDKYLASQLHAVDSLMRESTQIGGEFGKFLRNTVDPMTNMWKTGMTILRPGHHIRNNIGDASSTYLAVGAFSPTYFRKATQVLAAHNSYDGADMLKSLQAGGFSDIPTTGDKILRLKLKGGKTTDLTSDGLFHSASNQGLMPNYHASENLDSAQTAGSSIYRKLMENKVTHFAGGVAEYGSHMQNLTHYMVFMSKNAKKFDNVDALAEAAARDVRKWHLGATMLTSVEKKYIRRLIPFYSWTRMALPLVAETMFRNPARITMFQKAQYNTAIGAGLNPASMQDPFPTDQMFPEWMTDSENGPVAKIDGHYFSIAPGFTSQDVIRQFVGMSPGANIAGSLTPLLKDPIELKTGTNLETGAKIKPGEYIDGQVPGLNWISSLTGVSPTNSLVNGKITQNASVASGAKAVGPLSPSVINFLTGLGITDQSQSNYIKEAQYEAKDAAQKASGN